MSILASLLLLISITNNINWGGDHWRSVLQADAKGYYAYLPAVFIHHDLHFGFLEEAETKGSNPNLSYDYRVSSPDGTINKYWCGTTVMQAPFFLVAHAVVGATGGKADGYGKPYVIAVCLAAICYALTGLWATAKILGRFDVGPGWQAMVLAVLLFGTHLFYYVIVAPGMSHVYSFALIPLFMLAALRYFTEGGGRSLVVMGALLGLIFLIRPVNVMVVLSLPFLAGSWQHFQSGVVGLWQHRVSAVVAVVLASAITSVQPLIYFLSTGHWWVDSYPGEHFNWADPHVLDILFSYKKGLFLYTPTCLLACVGLAYLAKRSRYSLLAWISFMTVLVYVLSSWWNWWYGGSFSARPFVEYLPFFAIPMGLALQNLPKLLHRGYVVLLLLAVLIGQVQTYQARYFRIHYEDMDRARYWGEFLRVDKLP